MTNSQAMFKGAAILIAGPTASGKSSLAVALARRTGGIIVNADSMQVYGGLEILTARPGPDDLRAAPHRLYGHVPPARDYSVGDWLRDAASVLGEIAGERRVAIVCGGTGLYFRALLGGLDAMPAIAPALRSHWRARMADEGPQALHIELAARDGEAASRIRPSDGQRILRAIEIVETTGAPLAETQRGAACPIVDPARAFKLVLTPERDVLRARIALRFDQMMAAGALDEARQFLAIPGAFAGTAGQAIGVPELARHLGGEIGLAQAVALAVTRSRQYAKRQDTWFRHQFDTSWVRSGGEFAEIEEKLSEWIQPSHI